MKLEITHLCFALLHVCDFGNVDYGDDGSVSNTENIIFLVKESELFLYRAIKFREYKAWIS